MVMSRVARAFSGLNPLPPPLAPEWKEDPLGLYQLLRAYYDNNGVYDGLATLALNVSAPMPARRPLRNPAHRVVEFYTSHLWPELSEETIEADKPIAPQIVQVWEWSNWDAKKRLAARQFAIYGDLFLRVVSENPVADGVEGATDADKRVYFQVLDTETVIDFDEDVRGFLTFLHIEWIDKRRNEATGELVDHYMTEMWTPRTLRIWDKDRRMQPADLGDPTRSFDTQESFGIDFIPVVHAKFQDAGGKRGAGSFTHALEKIDELNMQATRLHQLLFRHNNVNWAVTAGGNDATGRPMPAVAISNANDGVGAAPFMRPVSAEVQGTVEMGGERFISLPGNAEITSLVPSIQYEAALNIINAQADEVERDLPELAFHRIRELGEISGRAARLMLSDAIDRVTEVRGNGLQALSRADAMALTMGKAIGIPEFATVGEFDAGDFAHTFTEEEVLAISPGERAEQEQAIAQAAILQHDSGWSWAATLRDRGFSEDEITKMQQEREAEDAAAVEQAARAFDAGAGGEPGQPEQVPPEAE